MKIINLPVIEIESLTAISERRNSMIFTQEYPWKKVCVDFKPKIMKKTYVKSTKKEIVNQLLNKVPSNVEVVYGIGGGAAIDVAKYIGAMKKLETIAIPTILSTDAFLTCTTAVRSEGIVRYIDSKHPDLLLIDFDLLKQAPKRLNVCGCADILSIYTGSFDWKYANMRGKALEGEKFDQYIYNIAMSILNGVSYNRHKIRSCDEKGLKIILDLLCMEVQLCNNYGNARPEEGSEHFFTYLIENYMEKPFLHGEMVGLGILLMSLLQHQDYEWIRELMDSIGLNYLRTGATKDQITKTLVNLPRYAKEKNLWYTYADELRLLEKDILDILDRLSIDQ